MSVELALELGLDDAASAGVVAVMERLEAAGIRSLRSLAPHVHPHVSLSVAAAAPAEVASACGGLPAALPALRLDALGAFVAPARVAYLAVTPTEPLLALHRTVHERLDAAGIRVRDLYRPGTWVPHVTVAMHVEDLGAAMAILESAPLPIRSEAVHLGIVEVPTGRLVGLVTGC